jgi:DNA-binding NtrC family response regulator
VARPKLLCVNDEPSWQECYKRFLGPVGYDVITVSTSVQPLKLLRDLFTVDAIILNYEMRGQHCNEIAVELKVLRPRLPIIIVSSCESVVQDALQFVDGAVLRTSSTKDVTRQLQQMIEDLIIKEVEVVNNINTHHCDRRAS